jgi:phosphatidate phosphatase APP1
VIAFKKLLTRFLLGLENDFTTFRKLGGFRSRRPFEVVPYLSFGTATEFFIRGRVVEDKGLTLATPDASRWRNLSDTYKRFVSDKVPHARLRVRYPGGERELEADAQGYFKTRLELPEAVPAGWCEVAYTLVSPLRKGVAAATATGFVLVPERGAQFGVISDMDDTVVQTDVTRWLRVLGAVLFGNAHTRLPFRGVAAFYRALERGTGGARNPLFYVSSSPWNLYDLLLEFLTLGRIPLGPLNLRAWRGGAGELFPSEHGAFKQNEIRRILDTFPELPFILIGDSGEEDPEIYGEIVAAYPGRVLGVYIRNVSSEARRGAVETLAQRVQEQGSKLILADDTLAAAQHAVAQGWIEEAALEEVRAQKERDTTFLDTAFSGSGADTVATVIEQNVRAR